MVCYFDLCVLPVQGIILVCVCVCGEGGVPDLKMSRNYHKAKTGLVVGRYSSYMEWCL